MVTPRSIIGLLLGSFLIIESIWTIFTDGFPVAGSTNRALMFFLIILGIALVVGAIFELNKPKQEISPVKEKPKKVSKKSSQ